MKCNQIYIGHIKLFGYFPLVRNLPLIELAAFLSMNIPEMEDPNIDSLFPGGGEVLSATEPLVMSMPMECIPGTSWGSLFSCIWGCCWPWCSIVVADEWPPCWSGGHWDPNSSWNWLLFIIVLFLKVYIKTPLSDFRPVMMLNESYSHCGSTGESAVGVPFLKKCLQTLSKATSFVWPCEFFFEKLWHSV